MFAAGLLIVALLAGWQRVNGEDCSRVGCAFSVGLVTSIAVVLASFGLFAAYTRTLPLRRYMRTMRRQAWTLLDRPAAWTHWESIVPREGLAAAVATELRAGNARRGASRNDQRQYITGAPGAGKTTFLVDLARWLARRGAVPVLVGLADETPPLDLPELARARFVRAVGRGFVSTEAAERLWTQLCLARRVVVLADGLEEAARLAPGLPLKELIADQPEPGVGWRLPIAVGARPTVLADDARESAFDLGVRQLEQRDVAARLKSATGLPSDAPDAAVEPLIDSLGLLSEPFYLQVLTALLATGAVRSTGEELGSRREGRERARTRLLARYFDAERLARGIGPGVGEVRTALGVAQELALQRLRRGDAPPAAAEPPSGPDRTAHQHALAVASRAGILEVRQRGDQRAVRFGHPIVQAYLAAQAVHAQVGDSEPTGEEWRSMLPLTPSVEGRLALRMVAAAGAAANRRAIVELLLQGAASRKAPAQRLLYAATAARAASTRDADATAEDDRLREEQLGTICALVDASWDTAAQSARIVAMQALGELDHPRAYELLWELAKRAGYDVRWELVEILARAGPTAWETLATPIRESIARTRRLEQEHHEARDAEARRRADAALKAVRPELSVVAKFLPALVDHADLPEAEQTLSELIEFVIAISPRGLGTEASLAQGFKRAAVDPAGAARAGDMRAEQIAMLLGAATFWYSRINAVHALARLTAALPEGHRRARETAGAAIRRAHADEHHLVRASARLARRALRAGDATMFVWHDESVEMRRSGEGRSRMTSQLVADVVLILNMNEQRFGADHDADERLEATRFDVGERLDLPHCIVRDRTLLIEDKNDDPCLPTCRFHLCPYAWRSPPDSPVTLEGAHRGHPSAAFCRHQRQLLTGHRLPQWLGWAPGGLRRASAWRAPHPGRKRALRRFWGEMEQRARDFEADARAMEQV
jgi:hypothetical protein